MLWVLLGFVQLWLMYFSMAFFSVFKKFLGLMQLEDLVQKILWWWEKLYTRFWYFHFFKFLKFNISNILFFLFFKFIFFSSFFDKFNLKTLVLTLVLLIIWYVVTIFSYDILVFIKIEENLAQKTANMIVLTNYFLPLQALNQIIQTYVSSQKITSPFFVSNIISFLISIYFGRKYIITDNYREIGFCYTRIVQEIFNVLFSLCVMLIASHRESLVMPNFKLISENFWNYACYSFKTAISFYGECFSFELNTYFAARLGDLTQLAAYIAIINCMVFVFFISIGFANTFRTNLGNTLGTGAIQEARANSLIYTIYVLIISLILIILLEIYSEQIAVIYTGHNDATPIVQRGIRAYFWNIFPTFILYSQSSVMRFLNRNTLAVQTTAIIMPILVLIISGFLAFKMEMGAIGLIYGFAGSKVFAIAIFFYVIYTVDWSKSYDQFKKENTNTGNDGLEQGMDS